MEPYYSSSASLVGDLEPPHHLCFVAFFRNISINYPWTHYTGEQLLSGGGAGRLAIEASSVLLRQIKKNKVGKKISAFQSKNRQVATIAIPKETKASKELRHPLFRRFLF